MADEPKTTKPETPAEALREMAAGCRENANERATSLREWDDVCASMLVAAGLHEIAAGLHEIAATVRAVTASKA